MQARQAQKRALTSINRLAMLLASTAVDGIARAQPVTEERTQPQNSFEERAFEHVCDEATNLLNSLELFYVESLISSE